MPLYYLLLSAKLLHTILHTFFAKKKMHLTEDFPAQQNKYDHQS